MPRSHSDEERAAWQLAEELIEQALTMMRQAEGAMARFKAGKELMVQRCARRGMSRSDAEIRWSSTVEAKNAISENSFHTTLASMYYNAAAAHYQRAHYLHYSARMQQAEQLQ